MKQFFLILLFFSSLLAISDIEATKENILKLKVPIIDIRTEREWEATGTIPFAIKLTFYTDNGSINPSFFEDLKRHHITKKTKFALICRTGHRSRIAVKVLEHYGFENVINLKGGMFKLFKSCLKGWRNAK